MPVSPTLGSSSPGSDPPQAVRLRTVSEDPLASPEDRFDEAGDATRRTRLANERTYLAWWRTGLTSLAVGLGAGKLVPALSKGVQWPYTVAGVGFTAIGVVFIAHAFVRHKRVDDALARGEFAAPERYLTATLAVAGILLGLLVLIVIVVQS
jgi:putative membrane protein